MSALETPAVWPTETLHAVMSALAHVLRTEGLPQSLYTAEPVNKNETVGS